MCHVLTATERLSRFRHRTAFYFHHSPAWNPTQDLPSALPWKQLSFLISLDIRKTEIISLDWRHVVFPLVCLCVSDCVYVAFKENRFFISWHHDPYIYASSAAAHLSPVPPLPLKWFWLFHHTQLPLRTLSSFLQEQNGRIIREQTWKEGAGSSARQPDNSPQATNGIKLITACLHVGSLPPAVRARGRVTHTHTLIITHRYTGTHKIAASSRKTRLNSTFGLISAAWVQSFIGLMFQ